MPTAEVTPMDATDIIQIVGIIVAIITSVVSIYISVKTLKQNSKMIKESTRPNITIYFDLIKINEPIGYFVLKNFGQTPAKIVDITVNDPLSDSAKFNSSTTNDLLKQFINATIAPNQKFLFPIEVSDYKDKLAIFDITYKNGIDSYSEHVSINVDSYTEIIKLRHSSDNNENTISNTLQELVERIG